MIFKIIKASEFNTVNWSGGTSTQLFIYPQNSDYKLRNFDFRLSTAKVEADESDFTSLPGISRKLMILEGEIEITHENHYSKKLAKFDIDTFEGDWATSSVGKCVDFNLMTRGTGKGKLSAISIKKDQFLNYPIENNADWLFIYLHSGEIGISHNAKSHNLNKGNLLVVRELELAFLELSAKDKSELIISKISLSSKKA